MVRKRCVTELCLPQPLKQLGLQIEPNWGLDFVAAWAIGDGVSKRKAGVRNPNNGILNEPDAFA